jgi:hypothetical protein
MTTPNAFTFTVDELASIKNRQVQRLIATKLESALKSALHTLRNDSTIRGTPSLVAYLDLLDKVEAAKSTKKPRTKKPKPSPAP